MTRRSDFIFSTLATPALLGIPTQAPVRGICALSAEREEGPFYVADEMLRSRIAEGRSGVPMILRLRVIEAKSCEPVVNAAVDVRQCDAFGEYSAFGATAGPKRSGGETFLRGVQITDWNGFVHFSTIFPGFYDGRVNHVHLKVRTPERSAEQSRTSHVVHTGQMFFPEAIAGTISAQHPYAAHRIERTTLADDHVYGEQAASSAVARMQRLDRVGAESYVASLTLVIKTGAAAG